MQTIVLYLCYFVLILLFSTAYNTSLTYCFVIWCLHTNKRRPCSSTLSGHPSSSLNVFLSKKCLVNHFFPSTNLQPYTFWEKFSHANVNEFDDWRAPSHCKTFGLVFRAWIGMGRPKWSINSGLDCIFLQIGLRKKRRNGWALGLTPLLFILGKFWVYLPQRHECWSPQVTCIVWWFRCFFQWGERPRMESPRWLQIFGQVFWW